jgi:hypothetical protein
MDIGSKLNLIFGFFFIGLAVVAVVLFWASRILRAYKRKRLEKYGRSSSADSRPEPEDK